MQDANSYPTERPMPKCIFCDNELTPGFIREKLSPLVPKYMLPSVFNWMQQMPRNPNGKIDRAKLVAAAN